MSEREYQTLLQAIADLQVSLDAIGLDVEEIKDALTERAELVPYAREADGDEYEYVPEAWVSQHSTLEHGHDDAPRSYVAANRAGGVGNLDEVIVLCVIALVAIGAVALLLLGG